jgi:histidinol-phosphatase
MHRDDTPERTNVARSIMLLKALEAAREAAAIIHRHYQAQIDVRIKADGSPVTLADEQAEEAIKAVLITAFPAHDFLGEETGRSGSDAEYLWLIDPIDGTKSFIRKYPFFSTQIALMRNQQVVLGVSCASEFGAGEVAWAERGQGAWLDDVRLRVSDVANVSACCISLGNQRTLARGPRWAKLGALVAEANRVRGYGDFYHYHLLAAGKIDAVIETDVNVLDIAALSLIVEEAGGRFTDLEGRPVGLETSSVLATNGHVHDTILSRLR